MAQVSAGDVENARNLFYSGQRLTLLDLNGVFVLSRKPSQVDAQGNHIADEPTAQHSTGTVALKGWLPG